MLGFPMKAGRQAIACMIVMASRALRSSSQPEGMPSSLSREWQVHGVNFRFWGISETQSSWHAVENALHP